MSNIDTMNSNSNLDCIADELVTELTSEASAVIEGGWGIHLYRGPNFTEQIAGANRGIPRLKFNNQAKSVRIDSGRWRFYDGFDYKNPIGTLDGNRAKYWHLNSWSNRVSSILRVG